VARNCIARPTNTNAAIQSLNISDLSEVTWMRSGAGPEVWRTSFEYSLDMNTWTFLGEGERIIGGWRLNGLSIPLNPNFYIRVRGHAQAGFFSSSGSIIEMVKLFYLTSATNNLIVTKSGNGTGTVTSNPAGINYGSTNSSSFLSGTVVTLTAAADANSNFAGWSGDYTGIGDSCTVTMNANKAVTAVFNIKTYTIITSVISGGTISPNGSLLINYGSDRTFTITPNTGYNIADVLVDGTSVGAVTSYTFTYVTGNHSISVTFAENISTPVILPGNIDTTSPGSANLVDGHDLYVFSRAFGSNSAGANWNPAADLNNNGTVDGDDLAILGANFGKSQ
jgi:hypothetical protein